MLNRHWGVTVDSEKPITGVVKTNHVEFIDDDIHNGIDLEWEAHVIECQGMCADCRCNHGGIAPGVEASEAGDCECSVFLLRGRGHDVDVKHAYRQSDDHDACGPDERGTTLIGDWKRVAKQDTNAVFNVGETGFAPDETGEYAAIVREFYTQVVWSKTARRVKLCSPCFPGQGDMGNPGDYLAFDLHRDMYGDGWDMMKPE